MDSSFRQLHYEQFLQDGLNYRTSDEHAIAAFSAAINLNSQRSEGFMYRGIVWADRGEYSLAEHDLRKALAIATCPIASYRLAFILSDREEHTEAVRLLENAITLHTTDGELWYLLGIILDRTNQHTSAVDALNTAAGYGYANDTGLLALRAKILNELGEWELAIQDCLAAIRYGGCSSEVFMQQGLAEYQLERWFAASVSFTRALIDDQLNPAIYLARSNAFAALGNLHAAEKDLRKARRLEINGCE